MSSSKNKPKKQIQHKQGHGRRRAWTEAQQQPHTRGETMPKNKGKGGKNRKRGKNESDVVKRELVVKEPGQGE